MAIFCPGSAVAVKSLIVGLSLLSYWNTTWSNSIFPLTSFLSRCFWHLFWSDISFSSKNSNTLSPAAAVDWSEVKAWAIWDNGFVNNLTYIINATITPNVIYPFIARSAPTIHTITYPKLPTKFISGCISPDKNWLFWFVSLTFSFSSSKVLSDCFLPLYTLTTFNPEYISSICPFKLPSSVCLATKYFWDFPSILDTPKNPIALLSIAVKAIIQFV